jgi:hypothetical protein
MPRILLAGVNVKSAPQFGSNEPRERTDRTAAFGDFSDTRHQLGSVHLGHSQIHNEPVASPRQCAHADTTRPSASRGFDRVCAALARGLKNAPVLDLVVEDGQLISNDVGAVKTHPVRLGRRNRLSQAKAGGGGRYPVVAIVSVSTLSTLTSC